MIERFIESYGERGYQFAYALCGNAEDAKELVQEAFTRLLRKRELYDESQPIENWFLGILRNVYYDSVKRYERKNVVSLDAELPGSDATLGDTIADGRDAPFL